MSDEIEDFLSSVNPSFAKYAEKLTEQGLTSTEELSFMQDDDFKHIGVPLFHWRKIVAEAKKQFGGGDDAAVGGGDNDDNKTVTTPSSNSTGGAGGDDIDNEMGEWGTDEVALFIGTLAGGAHSSYAKAFVSKGVDGSRLLQLSSVKQLSSIVPDLSARYAIWEAVQDCKVTFCVLFNCYFLTQIRNVIVIIFSNN